jgi:tetratricopeptide (TPR) repeat protein
LANYGDWRQFHPDANASLLLRRSYYRSITDNVTPNFGLHFYETMTDQDVPDWARIALSRPFSVWVGNTFLQKGVTGEMKEIQQLLDAFPAGDDHRLSKAKVVELLNADNSGPWRKNGLEVVSRGLWGARAQRHLLNMVDRSYYHLQDMLGVPQEAAQWRQAFLPLAQASRLGPILSFHLAQSQSDYDAAMEGAGILVNHHPELVTAANWQDLLYQPRHWQFNTSVPIYPTWFHPWFPDGTTFDTGYRLSLDYLQRQAGPDDFAIWQKMAPRKPSIALGRLRTRYGESPPPAAARELLGAMAEYNLVCAQTLADDCKDDVAAYEEAMKTVCGLSSDQYLTLGDYLAERGRDDDAAAAYQKAVDLADDRVWVAGDVDFLVNYYYDHDRRDDALTVAKMAAEVYSCAGLDTLARLDLRMKKYPDALDVANAAYQRYGDSTMLTAVYLFWKRDGGGDDVQQEVARRLSQIFPDGIEEAHLADLAKGPAPADGVKLLYENGRVRRNGLQQFDVIVAVNGRRVRNGLQYNAALDLSPTDDIDLIFWRDGQYQEKTVHLSSRRFFVDISDDVKT